MASRIKFYQYEKRIYSVDMPKMFTPKLIKI